MIRPLHFIVILLITTVALANIQVDASFTKPERPPRHKPLRQFKLSFSGDIIQHMPQLSAARMPDGSYNFARTFAYIDTIWRSVDFAVINYETTVSADGKFTGFPRFSAPPDVAAALHKAGMKVAALANNHVCDKGKIGMAKTIQTLREIGLLTTGSYVDSSEHRQILMLNKDNFRVAMLNYTYSTNGMPIPRGTHVNLIDTVAMAQDIRRAREDSSATHVVAFMHWGVEYQRKANKAQRNIGHWLRAQGVDAVIGSHPHVVQDIDTANRIVYSLGNFISNQQDQYTDSGLTVVVTLEHKKPAHIAFAPHWCDKYASVAQKEKYRVVTERDTTLNHGVALQKMRQAIAEARQAVGHADELTF